MEQQRKNSTADRSRDLSANDEGTLSPIDVGRDEWPPLPPRPAPAGIAGPTIPRGIFPPWVDDWADAWAASFQVDRSLLLGNALGAAATLTQGRSWVYAKAGEWKEGTNLFVALAANSGSLKSPAYERAFGPVVTLEDELRKVAKPLADDAEIERNKREREIQRKESISRTTKSAAERTELEAQIAADKKALKALPDVILPDLVLPTNMTPETVVRHLARQGGILTIASGEDSFMPIVSGRYSEDPAIESFLDCYSNKATGSHRIDEERSFDVPGPTALSIVTSTQPSALREFLGNERSKGRGLHARFIFLVLRTPPTARFTLHTPPVSQSVEDAYRRRMMHLGLALRARETQEAALSLHLDGDALRAFDVQYARLRLFAAADATSPEDGAFAAKSGGTILRLAALLHLLREPPPGPNVAVTEISGATMEGAIRLFHLLAQHYEAARIVAASEADPGAGGYVDRVLTWIADPKRGGTFSRRDLGRKFRDAKLAGEAVDELLEVGLLRERTQVTAGRRARVYDVHPAAAAYFAQSVPCPWKDPPAIDGRKDGSPLAASNYLDSERILSSSPYVPSVDERTEALRDGHDPNLFRPCVQPTDGSSGRKSTLENKPDSSAEPPSVLLSVGAREAPPDAPESRAQPNDPLLWTRL